MPKRAKLRVFTWGSTALRSCVSATVGIGSMVMRMEISAAVGVAVVLALDGGALSRCCRRHTGASRKCASRRIASAGPVCPSGTTRPWDERLLFPLKLVEEPGAAEVYWWRNRGQRRYIQRPTVEIPRRWSPGDPGGRVEEEEGKGRRCRHRMLPVPDPGLRAGIGRGGGRGLGAHEYALTGGGGRRRGRAGRGPAAAWLSSRPSQMERVLEIQIDMKLA